MNWNLKTLVTAATASLVVITSSLSAADDSHIKDHERRLNDLEKRSGGVITPSARLGVNNGYDVFVTAAALYWKPNETGLSYAIQENGSNANFADDGEVLESRGKYHWGFKVGLGYNMPYDGWDLYLNWTHFRAKNDFDCCEDCDECDECDSDCGGCDVCQPCSPCIDDSCPNIMFPVTVDFAANPIPLGAWDCDAFSRWKLHIDMLDLDLGRAFYVSKALSLRPFAGLRGLWIRQQQDNVYLGMQAAPKYLVPAASGATANSSLAPGSFNTPNVTYLVENEEKFRGVGPRVGMDTMWSFGRGFGLYACGAISLIYGRLDVEHEESYTLGEPTSPCDDECECECEIPVLEIEGNEGRCKRQWFTRAVTDITLGLSWDRQLGNNDRYHLGFALGWEHHMFFGLNQFLRFHDKLEQGSMTTNQGDLATQGWTLSGRFDF